MPTFINRPEPVMADDQNFAVHQTLKKHSRCSGRENLANTEEKDVGIMDEWTKGKRRVLNIWGRYLCFSTCTTFDMTQDEVSLYLQLMAKQRNPTTPQHNPQDTKPEETIQFRHQLFHIKCSLLH